MSRFGTRTMTRLTLVVAVLAFCRPAAAQPVPAVDRALAREILEQLVQIPTTDAEGTARAAEAISARLLSAGFPREDVHLIRTDANVANVVVRYRGATRGGAVLLMAHIDVVPAQRGDWSLDPWTFVERDGWFYGRGTSDNKAGAAMLMANFITLKRAGWQPARDLIIVLTGDEETAQRGIQSLLSAHGEKVNAVVAFNTDGGGVTLRDGRPVVFEVQVSEKIYADFQLEVTDVGGHSSLVRPDNPIYTLAAALTRIGEHQFPLLLSDATRMFLERSAATEQGQTAIDMRAVAGVPPNHAAAARLSRSPFYNAQLRTTCVATRVEAGHANNALPQRASAVINCRILPGVPGAEVESVIRKLAGDRVRVSVLEPPIASPASPPAPAVLSRIEPLAAKYWPGVPVIPVMSTGTTDGMYTRSGGIPTYGVSAIDSNPDDVRAHGKDERVSVESFYRAAQFWLELMKVYGDDKN